MNPKDVQVGKVGSRPAWYAQSNVCSPMICWLARQARGRLGRLKAMNSNDLLVGKVGPRSAW